MTDTTQGGNGVTRMDGVQATPVVSRGGDSTRVVERDVGMGGSDSMMRSMVKPLDHVKMSLPPMEVLNNNNYESWLIDVQVRLSMRDWEDMLTRRDVFPEYQKHAKAILLACTQGSHKRLVQASATVYDAVRELRSRTVGAAGVACKDLTKQLFETLTLEQNESVQQLAERVRELVNKVEAAGGSVDDYMQGIAFMRGIERGNPSLSGFVAFTCGQLGSRITLATAEVAMIPVGAGSNVVGGAFMATAHNGQNGTENVDKLNEAVALLTKEMKGMKKKVNQATRGGGLKVRGRSTMLSMRCYNCQKIGHRASECNAPRLCNVCKKPGHMASECWHAQDGYMSHNNNATYRGNGRRGGLNARGGGRFGGQRGRGDKRGGTARANQAYGYDRGNDFMEEDEGEANMVRGLGSILTSEGNAGQALFSMTQAGIASFSFVLDGGATHHMTPHRTLFRDYREAPGRVKVANNAWVPRAGVGSIEVQTKVNGKTYNKIIPNVWHVPNLGQSLLSTMQLKRQGCWHISGRKGDTTEFIFDKNNELWLVCPEYKGLNVPEMGIVVAKKMDRKGEVSVSERTQDSMCKRDTKEEVKSNDAHVAFMEKDVVNPEAIANYANANHASDKENPKLWHQRLGHVSMDNLCKLVKGGLVKGVNVPPRQFTTMKPCHCEVCVMAKHRRAPFKLRSDRVDEPLHTLHSDMNGPYPVASIGGGKYVLTCLDECTEYSATMILKSKAEASKALQTQILQWEKQTGKAVKRLYTDRGSEYLKHHMKQFCDSKGIVHEKSVPYTPQENGKAERLNETLNDIVRAMLIQYNLYAPLWSYAMVYATLIKNCTLASRLNITPYQAMWGKVPDVSSFRTFGCKVYARIPEQKRKKLDWKSMLGVYLGPELQGSGCKVLVYDPSRSGANKYMVHVVRDVVTYESLKDTVGVQDYTNLYWGGKIPYPTPVELAQEHEEEPMTGQLEPIDPLTLPLLMMRSRDRAKQVGANLHDETRNIGALEPNQHEKEPSAKEPRTMEGDNIIKETGKIHEMREAPKEGALQRENGGGTNAIKRVGVAFNARDAKKPRREREGLVMDLMHTFGVDDKYHGPIPVLHDADKYECPKSIKQCMASPFAKYWAEAIVEEWLSLVNLDTWEIVERERHMKVIPCHWVFVVKTDANGRPERFKARLVAGGNHQEAGVDFEETYAPVSKLATLRVLLSVAAQREWKVHQIDIKTAFLNGEVDTDIYMMQPPGFVDNTSFVCKLKKCLYGLKQSPRQWYKTLSSLLEELGFESVPADTSFWVRKHKGPAIVYLTTVVDDMLVTSCDEHVTLAIISNILDVFKGTTGGIAHHYDGMKITWLLKEKAVVLSQPKHIEAMLDRFKHLASEWYPMKLPMKEGLKLHKNGTSDIVDSDPLDVQKYPYRGLVGSLNYVACTTRPDVAFTVNQLAKYSHAPTQAHWDVAINCLRYLVGTKYWGLRLGSDGGQNHEFLKRVVTGPLEASAYADSNHATGIDDKKSVSGYVLQVYGGPVTWASRTQKLTSTSSTESEYRALSDCAKDVLWLNKIIEQFGITPRPFVVLGDSKGAIDSIRNYSATRHTKHIEIHHDFLKERYALGQLNFVHIPGEVNPADIFTKALGRLKFERFRSSLGMVNCEGEVTHE